jgi:hypothetical protein
MKELLSPVKIRMIKEDIAEIDAMLGGNSEGTEYRNKDALQSKASLRQKRNMLQRKLDECTPQRLKGADADRAYKRIKEIDGIIADCMKKHGLSKDGLMKEQNWRAVDKYEKEIKNLRKERRDLALLLDTDNETPGYVEHLRKGNYGKQYEI